MQDIQGRLTTNAKDKANFSKLVCSLKHTQQQLQQGRVVLQHLQRLLLAVASDDLGVTVLQQLLLPAIGERLQATVATRAAHLTAANEAMQQLQALWELPENADVLERGLLAKAKHAAALQKSFELLGRCLAAVKQFDDEMWAEYSTTGLETPAKVGGWLTMHCSKVAAGLLLLEQQAGKQAADRDGSSSSRGGGGADASASGSSSCSSSAEQAAIDVLVATTWGQSCELLLLIFQMEREFCNSLPVEQLEDEGKLLAGTVTHDACAWFAEKTTPHTVS
jgi:hypothetical protein